MLFRSFIVSQSRYCGVSDFEDEINNIKQQAKSAIAELENAKEKWLNKKIEIEVNDEKE